MPNFAYMAFDARGKETRGTLPAAGRSEACQRLKDMGLFPAKVAQENSGPTSQAPGVVRSRPGIRSALNATLAIPGFRRQIKPKVLASFTRQVATLVAAGMPLLRGLRLIQEQETRGSLKGVIGELVAAIEDGASLSEALVLHPGVFNELYINMVKAGELGGVLEVVLQRLAEFMEKAQKVKGKIIAAMFYPVAVMVVAVAILGVLMVFVVPKFQEVFAGLLNGAPMPAFTQLILGLSQAVKEHFVVSLGAGLGLLGLFKAFAASRSGRQAVDRCKLKLPLVGPVLRKAAISRFARTLGTLVGSGVPILQALTIVKETAGNVIVGQAVASVHASVKEGETITAPLEASGVFPPMVISMVDVGEQTGALPEMLLKIADNYDDEVDNAVAAMTSLLEPIMIIFLAVIVGSIVIAMFLPLIELMNKVGSDTGGKGDKD